jgi:hypothetical protein
VARADFVPMNTGFPSTSKFYVQVDALIIDIAESTDQLELMPGPPRVNLW